jgi:hypothetical protein
MKLILTTALLSALSIPSGFAEDESKTPCPPPAEAALDYPLKLYKDVQRGLDSYLTNSSELKKFDKLASYIDSQSQGRFSKYNFTGKIRQASKKFYVPTHLIACTIMEESHFEPGIKDSHTGAMGLAQWEDIARQAFNNRLKTDQEFRDEWISAGWKTKTGAPREINIDDLKSNTSLMISATALRMKYDARELFGEALGSQWTVGQMKVLVAQYNLGPGGLHKRCGELKNSDPEDCISNLKKLKGKLIQGTKKHADRKASQAWYEMDGAAQCMLDQPSAAR